MSGFIQQMSIGSNMSIGENGHAQYGRNVENSAFMEQMTNLFFQLVRTKDEKRLENVRSEFRVILESAKKEYELTGNVENLERVFVLIGQTRDIVKGKGEYLLTYVMLDELAKVYPELTERMVQRFVDYDGEHPLGSWKDVKYFASFVNSETKRTRDYSKGMKFRLASLFTNQLKNDVENMRNKKSVSLAAKWLPSEKSKESWLFKEVAEQYSGMIPLTIQGRRQMYKNLRSIKSELNKYLDTTQVKMCGKKWSEIDFNNVTSVTMTKQRLSFMNVKSNDTPRYPDDDDRNKCAEQFAQHVDEVKKNVTGKKVNGKRTSIYDLVKGAIYAQSKLEKDVINEQWKAYRENNPTQGELGYMIPMADTSASMEVDKCIPLYHAIGLGIRCSELASGEFKDKVLTFSSKPTWVDLSQFGDDFVGKVKKLRQADWGMNTDFYKAMELILDAAVKSKMTPEQVSKLNLCVFSDMQIDSSFEYSQNKSVMFDNIKQLCKVKGQECGYEVGFNAPHVVFWNLRQTDGFPVQTRDTNATMVSGYSATLLNHFLEKGPEEMIKYTPELMLMEILDDNRYEILRADVRETVGYV
jgi:hypothetical protein